VDKSLWFLRQRLLSSNKQTMASSFTDRATAERSIVEALLYQAQNINTWLGKPGRTFAANGPPGAPNGDVLLSGNPQSYTTRRVRIVLVKDATTGLGYRIDTAYTLP
jgi:hypothetical protein